MKSIPVNSAKPNTFYNSNIYLDDKYIVLTPDVPVTLDLLNRLKKWGFSEVFTLGSTDSRGSSDGEEEADTSGGNLDSDVKEREALEEVNNLFDKALTFSERLFDDFLRKGELAIAPATDMVKKVIEMIKLHRRYILRLTELAAPDKDYMIQHSVKTCILAVAIGEDLKLPPHRLIELGLAGLLHKIGMFKLPASIRNQAKPLTTEEKKALTAYPIIGYRVLKDFSLPSNITLAVLEHQERMDGSGYPQKLNGDKISPNARILAIASSYIAQISSRPYREAKNGHSSIIGLLKQGGVQYDENILKKLVFLISLYPLGSYVQLKNNAYAVIVDTNASEARFPVIKLVTDEYGSPLPEARIRKTSENSDYQIARVLDNSEVSQLKGEGTLP